MSFYPEILTMEQWLKKQMDDPDVVERYGLTLNEGRLSIERPNLAGWAYNEQVKKDSLAWYEHQRRDSR